MKHFQRKHRIVANKHVSASNQRKHCSFSKRLGKSLGKATLCFALSLTLATSGMMVPPEEHLAQADPLPYVESAQKAVDITNSVLNTLGVKNWGDAGKGLVEFAGYLSKGLKTTNTILKFLGFGKKEGPSLDELMYQEIQAMHSELISVNNKLDSLISELKQYEAHQEYKETIAKADELNNRWVTFTRGYSEKLDDLMSSYETAMNNGIRDWFYNDSSDARKTRSVDNTSLCLVYEELDGGFTLVHSDKNGIPSGMEGNRYLIIKEGALSISTDDFSIDNYQDLLIGHVKSILSEAMADPSKAADLIEVGNYGIFTEEGWNAASDEEKQAELDVIAEDVLETLTYRISLVVSEKNTQLATDILNAFNNYCANISRTDDQSLCAALKAICLTHGFEGEAKELLNSLAGSMIAKTAEYAVLTIDIVSKCPTIQSSKVDEASSNWLSAIESIQPMTSTMKTGNDDYCYVASARLKMIEMEFLVHWLVDSTDSQLIYTTNDIRPIPGSDVQLLPDKTAQVLNLIKLGNSSLAETNYATYLQEYVETEVLGHIGGMSGEHQPTLYLVNPVYHDSQFTKDDKVAFFTDYSSSSRSCTHPLGTNVKMADIDLSKAYYNVKVTAAKVLDTDHGEIIDNAIIAGFIGYKPNKKNFDDFDMLRLDTYPVLPGTYTRESGWASYYNCESSGAPYTLALVNEAPEKVYATAGTPDGEVLLETGAPSSEGSFSFLDSLQQTVNGDVVPNSSTATSFGEGNIPLICVLTIAIIIAIGGGIAYSKRKKSVEQSKE